MWHQLGFNTQLVVKEFLQAGVGVIVSPKDLAHDKALEHASQYKSDGPDVLLNPQFYVPEYSAGKVGTYPTAAFRQPITTLGAVTERDLHGLARALEDENRKFGTSAVVAPALPYEAARPDIEALNSKLFRAAKKAGDAIGVPTYGTVAISQTLSTMDLRARSRARPRKRRRGGIRLSNSRRSGCRRTSLPRTSPAYTNWSRPSGPEPARPRSCSACRRRRRSCSARSRNERVKLADLFIHEIQVFIAELELHLLVVQNAARAQLLGGGQAAGVTSTISGTCTGVA
ncbi:hypothetical protein ML401_34890 (plasmid) [Bradyrhizobium sp. 62B]|uniref:hypothetical protein n=1 Tax=Bradyrhizobium sp. 62B TaxID=2898442 RepID=UPI0025581369|nr:hypothetical protein ML401_34890 [Bradyrhizobium sp. 62B]